MFALNKYARSFILRNFITVRNGFVNEGLIEFKFDTFILPLFNSYIKLEKLYFEVIKRNSQNRNITIDLRISEPEDFSNFIKIVEWIKA